MYQKKISKYNHTLNSIINKNKELKKLEFNEITKNIKKAYLAKNGNNHSTQETILFSELNNYKKKLENNHEKVTYEVFNSPNISTVSDISKKAASPKKWCKFFYYLSSYTHSKNILEIGTNLGISGQYFVAGLNKNPEKTSFTTLEGVPKLCDISAEQFHKIADNDTNIQVIQGLYEDTLSQITDSKKQFDLVFFDGNHKYQATIDYFNLLKNNYKKDAILIFDDINWSEEMQQAWKYIQEQDEIYFIADFFKAGIVLYNPNIKNTKIKSNLFLTL
jgi:predicted O-methyltransferase YrrM